VRLLVAGGELLRRGGLNAGGGGGQHQVASGELEQPHLALQLQDLAEKTESGGTWHSLWRSRRRNSIRHGAELLKSAAQPEPGEEPGTTRCRAPGTTRTDRRRDPEKPGTPGSAERSGVAAAAL
jgi:hypothetical protein